MYPASIVRLSRHGDDGDGGGLHGQRQHDCEREKADPPKKTDYGLRLAHLMIIFMV
jgi:hypothetical protein